jgi:hypothetical protein
MNISSLSARHFRHACFGGNWTCSALRPQLEDVSFDEAMHQRPGFLSIAVLSFHVLYYVGVLKEVLEGKGIHGNDEQSFKMPAFQNGQAWQNFLDQAWKDIDDTAGLLEAMRDEKLNLPFEHEKYGTYFRNIHGIIEHLHYHLGQIVVLKKILRQEKAAH